MQISLITLYTAHIAELARIADYNKKDYCALHGYDYRIERETLDPSRPPVWSKLLAILKHLPNCDWLFWSDVDSLVLNFRTRLETFCDDNADLVLTHDTNGLNIGQMLVHNTPQAAEFLRECYAQSQFVGHIWQEQQAMIHVMQQGTPARIKIVPQRTFNSYLNNYQKGDFLLHFAGPIEKTKWLREFATRTDLTVKNREELESLARELNVPIEHANDLADLRQRYDRASAGTILTLHTLSRYSGRGQGEGLAQQGEGLPQSADMPAPHPNPLPEYREREPATPTPDADIESFAHEQDVNLYASAPLPLSQYSERGQGEGLAQTAPQPIDADRAATSPLYHLIKSPPIHHPEGPLVINAGSPRLPAVVVQGWRGRYDPDALLAQFLYLALSRRPDILTYFDELPSPEIPPLPAPYDSESFERLKQAPPPDPDRPADLVLNGESLKEPAADPAVFHPLPREERTVLRAKSKIDGDFVFLHVGDMSLLRDTDLLLRAFAAVAEIEPRILLVLKGIDALGHGDNLAAAIKLLNDDEAELLRPRMRYIGDFLRFKKFAQLYQLADAYVTPRRDNVPQRPSVEALASGLVIAGTQEGADRQQRLIVRMREHIDQWESLPFYPPSALRVAKHFTWDQLAQRLLVESLPQRANPS